MNIWITSKATGKKIIKKIRKSGLSFGLKANCGSNNWTSENHNFIDKYRNQFLNKYNNKSTKNKKIDNNENAIAETEKGKNTKLPCWDPIYLGHGPANDKKLWFFQLISLHPPL